MAHLTTISDRIEDQVRADHNEIRNSFSHWEREWMATPQRREEGKKWYHQFVWSVARHSVAEEVVLYPLYESKLGAFGKTHAEISRAEHHDIKTMLRELEDMSVDDCEFVPKMNAVMESLNRHMKHEEEVELKELTKLVLEADRIHAGKSFERRKMIAPTHPHPNAPDDAPNIETLVGLLALPFDKMRDLFRDFPSKHEVEATREGPPTTAVPVSHV